SSLDPIIGIYDSTGKLLYHNDDHISFAFFFGSSNFDSSARFVVPASGNYYIAVGGFSTSGPPNALPANANMAGTGPGAGSTGAYTAVIGLDIGDQDFYSVELEAGDVLGANVPAGFLNISIRAPDGSEMMGSAFGL